MATELSMNGRKKIETIQKEFTGKFPYLTLVFLDAKRQTIDISKSLSEVRKVKGDDVSIIASLKVNTLEKRFLDNFGIIVEVAYQKQEKLIFTKDNVNLTLNELNKWCSEHKCDKFQFTKSLKGNTLMSIQDQLLQAIKEIYPLAEAKKINKDNSLDIFIPETNTKRGSHLFFNTSKGEIKVGFYCRDEEFIENVLSNSSNIEKYSQGIRILNNPLQSNVDEAVNNALSFINEIINSSGTSSNSVISFETNVNDEESVEIDSKVDIGTKFRESYTDDEELAESISSYLEDFSERGKIVVLEIKEKDLIKATEDHDLFSGEFFTVIGVVDLKSWEALSKLIGKVESDWAKEEFKEEDPMSITLLYSNGIYVYAYSVPKEKPENSSNADETDRCLDDPMPFLTCIQLMRNYFWALSGNSKAYRSSFEETLREFTKSAVVPRISNDMLRIVHEDGHLIESLLLGPMLKAEKIYDKDYDTHDDYVRSLAGHVEELLLFCNVGLFLDTLELFMYFGEMLEEEKSPSGSLSAQDRYFVLFLMLKASPEQDLENIEMVLNKGTKSRNAISGCDVKALVLKASGNFNQLSNEEKLALVLYDFILWDEKSGLDIKKGDIAAAKSIFSKVTQNSALGDQLVGGFEDNASYDIFHFFNVEFNREGFHEFCLARWKELSAEWNPLKLQLLLEGVKHNFHVNTYINNPVLQDYLQVYGGVVFSEEEMSIDGETNESDNSSNLLNDFFENLILNFPSVELKEIKENDFVHIYMPDLYLDKEKSHLYFTIKNDKIEIGFYVLDHDFINNVLQYSEKIEVNKNDLRLKGNPTFENDFPDAFDAAMTFIWEIQKCIASSLEVDDEDFSITEGIDDFSKFDIKEEDIVNKLSQKIKNENVIPQLLFINSAFENENSEIKSNHQAYFFTSDVLISDRELQGFLYVNMDGFYSNCLGEDVKFILSWDKIIDFTLIEENDSVEIEIEIENGELTIKEKDSKSLKILYSFYKYVWQKVVKEFKDQPIISWNTVFEMGIQGINFNTLEDYIEWSNEEIISNEKKKEINEDQGTESKSLLEFDKLMSKEAISLLNGLEKGLKSNITLYFGKKDLDEYSTIQGEYNNPFDIEESMSFYQFTADLSIIWRKGELVTNSLSIKDIINLLSNKKLGELRPDDFIGLMRGDCEYPEVYENELVWKFNEEENDGPAEYELESLLSQSSIEYINQTFDFTGVQRFTIQIDNNVFIEIVDEIENDLDNVVFDQELQNNDHLIEGFTEDEIDLAFAEHNAHEEGFDLQEIQKEEQEEDEDEEEEAEEEDDEKGYAILDVINPYKISQEFISGYLKKWQYPSITYNYAVGIDCPIPDFVEGLYNDDFYPKFSSDEIAKIRDLIYDNKIIPILRYNEPESLTSWKKIWWIIPFCIWKQGMASMVFVDENGFYGMQYKNGKIGLEEIADWGSIKSIDFEYGLDDDINLASLTLNYHSGGCLTFDEFISDDWETGSYLAVIEYIWAVREDTILASKGQTIWFEGVGGEGFVEFTLAKDLLDESKWLNPDRPDPKKYGYESESE